MYLSNVGLFLDSKWLVSFIWFVDFPAMVVIRDGLGQHVFMLSRRGSRANVRFWDESTPGGVSTSRKSPGHKVVVVVCAWRRAAFVRQITCGLSA